MGSMLSIETLNQKIFSLELRYLHYAFLPLLIGAQLVDNCFLLQFCTGLMLSGTYIAFYVH
jgi:hypothetical protein